MKCQPVLHVQDDDDIPIGKIVCLARTYKLHAEEMGHTIATDMAMFLKPASTIIQEGQCIFIPEKVGEVHHEVEMAVIIGRPGSHIPVLGAASHIYGYTVAIDVTARDIQRDAKRDGLPWTTSKGYDTFCPIGTVIPASRIPNPHALELSLFVNGELRQASSTANLRYTVEEIISTVSEIMTLCRGDIILTGTPEGVGPLQRGDIVEAQLDANSHLTVSVE